VRDGGECTCGPLGYRASIRDWDTNERKVSHTFETAMEALAWQQDQLVSAAPARDITPVGRGDLGAVIDEFLQAAEDGMARDGRNERYTRERIRALRGALSYAESELGSMEIQDIRRRNVQALIDQLSRSGVAPTRIGAVADALSDVYTYAIRRELVGFNPVVELQVPQYTNGGPPTQPVPAAEAAQRAWTSDEPVPPPQPGFRPAEPAPPRDAAQRSWSSEELVQPTQPAGPPWTPPPFDLYQNPAAGPPAPEPPPYAPPGYASAPPSWSPPQPGYPTTPNAYTAPYLQPGYSPGTTSFPHAPPYGQPSTGFSSIFGAPGDPAATDAASMQERWLWWTVRIIVIVFVLIALVLVAESV
jgi:hypothetical protein